MTNTKAFWFPKGSCLPLNCFCRRQDTCIADLIHLEREFLFFFKFIYLFVYMCECMYMRWGCMCTWRLGEDVGSLEAGVNRHFRVARLVT